MASVLGVSNEGRVQGWRPGGCAFEGEGLNCSQTWFVPTRTVWKRTTKLNKHRPTDPCLGKEEEEGGGTWPPREIDPLPPHPSVRPWRRPSLLSFFSFLSSLLLLCFPSPTHALRPPILPLLLYFPASLLPCFSASLSPAFRPHLLQSPTFFSFTIYTFDLSLLVLTVTPLLEQSRTLATASTLGHHSKMDELHAMLASASDALSCSNPKVSNSPILRDETQRRVHDAFIIRLTDSEIVSY